MPRRLNSKNAGFDAAFARLIDGPRGDAADCAEDVRSILADVRKRGDAALIALTRKFDHFDLTPESMRVAQSELKQARAQCDQAVLHALEQAALRIKAFHERQYPENHVYSDVDGIRLGYRWTPVKAAGIYVPGGTASYPSSVLMNAIPALVAGVERRVMCVPAPDGELDPLVLAAAELAGVSEIYRIGGAQAIAALAFGTETIGAVDKIVGPGNQWVAEAKRQVFGTVGIDMIAGPSEILVIADAENDPAWIAADLLSQAEHDELSLAILMTDDETFADAVEKEIENHLDNLSRADIARASWDTYGTIIVIEDLAAESPTLIDTIAPEHLELAVGEPETFLENIRNAGAVFLGRYCPEALGDYVAGPNHVLPTSRSARFSSGLAVTDFMKRTTFVGCDAAGIAAIGPAAATLADAEGLPAHALSVRIRTQK